MHHLCLRTAEAQVPSGSWQSHLGKAGELPSIMACPQGHIILTGWLKAPGHHLGPWPSPSWTKTLWEGSLATSGFHST